ncbi:uncharacterized protein LOC118188636 [Stegodyphus dumicola]|uniref:uncharacterized protein LOC118188636 n=1 Tax=Stegodyphus dumicola TaxID=202533 RepID=UPI0015A8FFFB|nr:uncharacterized protein LOC118188636 [Stegodyphus dumicola]
MLAGMGESWQHTDQEGSGRPRETTEREDRAALTPPDASLSLIVHATSASVSIKLKIAFNKTRGDRRFYSTWMRHDQRPTTAYIVENLLFLFVTSVPVITPGVTQCGTYTNGSRSHIPLRINMLHIPTPVVTGDSVRLKCGYELGNETLYAVKWYKNMGEFFRYVPASEPPLKTFPQLGIDVDGFMTAALYEVENS